MPVLRVNTDALNLLAERLQRVSVEASEQFRVGMLAAGQTVADTAKVRVHSDRAAEGIQAHHTGGATVAVTATGLAGIMENKGKGKVRHPTFGHDPWTSKNSRPEFLKSALRAVRPKVKAQLLKAISDAFHEAGLE